MTEQPQPATEPETLTQLEDAEPDAPQVGIIMGSQSDMDTMQGAAKVLEDAGARVVDVELVEQLHADAVGDEAAEDALAEQLRRGQSLRALVAHPSVVAIERVLGAPEEVRDPADIALGEREA